MILLEPVLEYRQQTSKLNSREAILEDKEVIINKFNKGAHIFVAEAGLSYFDLHYGCEYQELLILIYLLSIRR